MAVIGQTTTAVDRLNAEVTGLQFSLYVCVRVRLTAGDMLD